MRCRHEPYRPRATNASTPSACASVSSADVEAEAEEVSNATCGNRRPATWRQNWPVFAVTSCAKPCSTNDPRVFERGRVAQRDEQAVSRSRVAALDVQACSSSARAPCRAGGLPSATAQGSSTSPRHGAFLARAPRDERVDVGTTKQANAANRAQEGELPAARQQPHHIGGDADDAACVRSVIRSFGLADLLVAMQASWSAE